MDYCSKNSTKSGKLLYKFGGNIICCTCYQNEFLIFIHIKY